MPRAVALVVVVLLVVVGALWFAFGRSGTGASPVAPAAGTSVASPPPAPRLTLDLAWVRGRHLTGRRVPARHLRTSADAVRAVMTQLYTAGFVDTAAWHGGRFPSVFGLFEPRTRSKVHRDLRVLTLGTLASHLDAVRPGRSTLGIRFLVAHTPIVAVANVNFRGTALAEGASLPIAQQGTFTLRHESDGWRIASYQVHGHLPSLQQVHRTVRRAAASPGLEATRTFFVLVIGSDARPGEPPSATRGDSIHIVGVNPARHAVSILGIPRDSFVAIPGVGTEKINSALVFGGPGLLVRTVERLTGVHIGGYVLTGFAGFQALVNAVGGITVDVPYRMSDPYSRAFFRPGPTHMTGRAALAFSRDRHDVPGGDFGRSVNQGRMLIDALRQLKADVARNPGALLAWITAGARILQTDLSLGDMVGLLLSMPSLDPGRVQNRVVSGTGAVVGGQDVIRLGASAQAMFRDFAADAIFNRS